MADKSGSHSLPNCQTGRGRRGRATSRCEIQTPEWCARCAPRTAVGSHALHTLRKRFHLSGDARTPDRAVTPPFPGSSPSATGWRNSCWVLTRGTARTQDPIMSEWSSLRPPSDVVARWAPASLALLLVDAETTHLPSIVRRLMAHLETLAWSAGGACYPKTATRTDDMIRQAVDSMVMAKKGGGNRLYVAS